MEIKYCEKCVGNPYTDDCNQMRCPECGRNLIILENASHEECEEWKKHPKLSFPTGSIDNGFAPKKASAPAVPAVKKQKVKPEYHFYGSSGHSMARSTGSSVRMESTTAGNDGKKAASEKSPKKNIHCTKNEKMKGSAVLTGRISNYRVSRVDHLLPVRLWNTLIYGQRLDANLHSFDLISIDADGRHTEYTVNVYGTINAGASLGNNTVVEARGRFTGQNIFMPWRISVVHGSVRTPVLFQHNRRMISIVSLIGVGLVLLLILAGSMVRQGGMENLLPMLKGFFGNLIFNYLLLLVVGFLVSSSRWGRRISFFRGRNGRSSLWLIMLAAAIAITLFTYNFLGMKNVLEPIVSAGITWLLGIAGMILGIGIVLGSFRRR